MKKIQAWQKPPGKSEPPKSDELHLWLIDLDASSSDDSDYLSGEEHDRAKQLLNPTGSRRFTAARGGLRRILGNYLASDPGSVSFRYGSNGKPEIAHPETQLRFNLSHSGRFALIAVTDQSEIGVDIEPLKSRPSLLPIAGKLFGQETRQALATMQEAQRTAQFFHLWTTLEARAKCRGNGVFSQPDSSIPALNFEPETGWIAAVAIARGVPRLSEWCTYRLPPLA